ncbi:CAP domain-containing protein [Roseateles sp. LYH14W]|uniref:CAP domain-containing protein n=1 Tax=Pelomonas parva TaxID=3299032 RepID=A0ABW7FBR4_9BURK
MSSLRRTTPAPSHTPTARLACSTPRAAPTAALALALALAGCGGGGSESSSAAPNSPVVAAPSPTTPAPANAGTRITCNLPDFQADMLAAVNAHRRAGATCGARGAFPAAAELTWNAQLTQAAVVHSDDMAAGNFFSHTGSNGSSAGDRVTAAGYAWRGVGENIAAGQTSVAQVVDGWMKSDGHRANLMNPAFRDIGVACIAGSASNTYRTYWSQEFGTPR